MKIKKLLSAVMAAVCAVSLLAGCNGNSGSSEPEAPVVDTIDPEMTSLEFTSGIKVGWSLGNTLDATGGGNTLSAETSWGNPKATQELIDAVKNAGFNAVRVPTTWGGHMDENHTIDAEWLARVKEVVDYAYNSDMYVILNMHHENWNYPYEDNKEAASAIIKTAWAQIAECFKDYDEHLIFEGLNEPRWVGTDQEWNGGNEEGRSVVNYLGQVFVDTVRATGGNNEQRFLMIPGYGANSGTSALSAIVVPDDPHIIVSVHAYIPYSFALAGTGTDKWNAERPNCVNEIDTLAKDVNDLFISKGIAVIVGETGAVSRNNDEARADWAEYFFGKFKEIGVPCFWWDNAAIISGEKFGLFNRLTYDVTFPLVVEGIMKGAGVTQ